MNRWAVRLIGLVMILIFLLVFTQMYKTLKMMEQQQRAAPVSR